MAKPIKQKNGKYRIEPSVGGRRTSGTFNTYTAAVDWGRWAEDELRAGRDPKARPETPEPPLSFEAWTERWKELRDVSTAYAARADSQLRTHIIPKFGKLPLKEVADGWEEMKLWVKRLRARDDLENSTVVAIYGVMSAVMTAAVNARKVDSSPCHHIKVADGAPRQQPYLDEHGVLAVSAELVVYPYDRRKRDRDLTQPNMMYAVMAILAAFTGMRWGEITGMRRDHRNRHGDLTVDLLRKRIIIGPDTVLHEVGGHLWMEDPKTISGARIVSLPPFLVLLLAQVLESHKYKHVFTGRKGGQLRRSNFDQRVWTPAIARLQPDRPTRDRPTFHSLRHTQETMLIADDIPNRGIDIRMEHAVPGAAGRYAHVHPDLDKRIVDSLEARYKAALAAAPRAAHAQAGAHS